MSRGVAKAPKRFQQVTLTTGSSARHGRNMESNKRSTGAKLHAKTRSRTRSLPSRARVDQIIEEIVDNLRPHKGSVKGCEQGVRGLIERGPRNHLPVNKRAVREYAKRLRTWIAEGQALLPKLESSGRIDVEHIPPGIRHKMVFGALDYREDYEDHHLQPDEFSQQLPNAYSAYCRFDAGLKILAAVIEGGHQYEGPVGPEGERLPVRSPNYDKLKVNCARDALWLILTYSKEQPSAAPHQNLRTVAGLLHKAYGGLSKTDLERACDSALSRLHRHQRTFGDHPIISQIFTASDLY
jgi:hypothetical protein